MKLFLFCATISCFAFFACTKSQDQPKSKTDYIPIISSKSSFTVTQGQPIISTVKMGFYDHFADITFLNFAIKESQPKQYDIRAKAFYDNITYAISLPVVSTFDTTLTLQTSVSGPGKYLLKFYSFNQLVQIDTVEVN